MSDQQDFNEGFRRGFIGREIKCLDHGFVRVVDVMGNDGAVVQAARVSYGEGTKSIREDKGLINYLLRKRHTTPFEMCEIKLHCKMPIFIARQWIRHRTANVNEYSMRYSEPIDAFYVPEPQVLAPQSKTNKQGRDIEPYSEEEAKFIRQNITDSCRVSFDFYDKLAREPDDEEKPGLGLARELSRMVLPLNAYTEWYWKIDVHNLLHFLHLRMDSHAQYEIRVFANAIYEFVKDWMPWTAEAFEEYILHAVTFSRKEAQMLGIMLNGGGILFNSEYEGKGFTDRERKEFSDKIEAMKAQGKA